MNRLIHSWYDRTNEPWRFILFAAIITPIIMMAGTEDPAMAIPALLFLGVLGVSRTIYLSSQKK